MPLLKLVYSKYLCYFSCKMIPIAHLHSLFYRPIALVDIAVVANSDLLRTNLNSSRLNDI